MRDQYVHLAKHRTPKILITMPVNYQKAFIGKEVEETLSSFGVLDKNTRSSPLSESELSSKIKDTEGVIVGWGDEGLSKRNLEDAEKLRIIGVIGSSVGKVHPEVCFKRKITIVNAAKANSDCVAEHTLAFMLCWLRRLPCFDKRMKEGAFSKKSWSDISANTGWDVGSYLMATEIGIVGMGVTGKRVIELLRPFQVKKIRAYSPHFPFEEADKLGVELTDLHEVLQKSDIISIHAALRKDTFHLIRKGELNLIKEGVIIINTARADIVDQKALISILKKRKIYAALDVFSQEPLPQESEFRKLDNVILTPHIAGAHIGGYSREIHQKIGSLIVRDFELFFSGKRPLNALSPERARTMT